MSRVEELWERLVRAALRRERTGEDVYGRPVGGIAGNVPSALAKNRDIDEILRVADEIQDDAPSVSRICMFSSNMLYQCPFFMKRLLFYGLCYLPCCLIFYELFEVFRLYIIPQLSPVVVVDDGKMLNCEKCRSPFNVNAFV